MTAKAKAIRKEADSTIVSRNREQNTTIHKIEEDMQREIDESMAALETSIKGENLGGLYQGIEEVGDNVTLVHADSTKIVGKKAALSGRLSV